MPGSRRYSHGRERTLSSTHEQIEELTTETARAQAKLGQPFKYRDELTAAYATIRKAISADLAQAADPPARPAAADPEVAASLAVLGATYAIPPQASGRPRWIWAAPGRTVHRLPERDSTVSVD
ncbi:hypothetical protein [Kribbella sp. NPDC051620]|uniref:hypothetical protein n=1 Tax=Kribbella sp. NPDC051620 TaxID=3364120 RepID=UPI00379C9B17